MTATRVELGLKPTRRGAKPTPRAVATTLRAQCKSNGYEITVEERDERLDEQGHRCAVCLRPFRPPRWHLVCSFTGVLTGRRVGTAPQVDHDHSTGLVRGLLCRWCNRNLVSLFDRHPEVMERARKYVREGGWRTD
jgi:hypothetical protein